MIVLLETRRGSLFLLLLRWFKIQHASLKKKKVLESCDFSTLDSSITLPALKREALIKSYYFLQK